MQTNTDSDAYLRLFRQALLIRRFEERIITLYPSDKIQSPVHLSIGQEPVAVGVCAALKPQDLVFATYRSHAFFIAKGGNLRQMMAELYGKVTGGAKGKAGSMHLTAPEVGFMGSSAVVASTIAHAVGAAMAAKFHGRDQIAVAVYGDGATEEGVYHESINFAAVLGVPVLFLCENNEYAIHSHISARQSYRIAEHAGVYGLPVTVVEDGNDLLGVEAATRAVVDRIRDGKRPAFLEIRTSRYKEHVGPGEDFEAGYRQAAALDPWRRSDPLLQRDDLIAMFEAEIAAEIDDAVAFAEASPWPGADELLTDVL